MEEIFTLNNVSTSKIGMIMITVISGRLPARPITRTGWLLHTAKKKSQQITRTGG